MCGKWRALGKAASGCQQKRIDKPMLNGLGQRLEHFTRVETFGDNAGNGNNDMNWGKVTVDTRSREVFSYTPVIEPANRVAVPAP
jgi:hypothetical protein